MKIIRNLSPLPLFFFVFLLHTNMVYGFEIEIALHSDWQFRQANQEEWLPATVPGTVHTDLFENGRIGDPFYRTNERDQQWIEQEDWEYRTIINASSDLIVKDKIILDFQGLDTYSDIFLNDSLIRKTNNMFRGWQVDVSNIIRKGENELRIYFHSPCKVTEPKYDSLSYILPVSSNDRSEKKLSVFSRKAPYHFGWDWGPRFVTSGIWKPVTLRAWDTAIIKEVYIDQKSLNEQAANLLLNLTYETTRPFFGTIQVSIDDTMIKESTIDLVHGSQTDNLFLSIENPVLWWPNGLGEQKIYKIDISLLKDEKIVHSKTIKTGLRTIELVQEGDRHGTSFYFKINGKAVFMKGANYIPQDNFLPRVTNRQYQHTLQSAREANMNMIRVWGGGIYENDIFYDLCDENGLLVWQDFMFSCAMYPGDSFFLENVRNEAIEQVKRLRHHPSMALWCGNNEILMKWQTWKNNVNEEGNQPRLWNNPGDSVQIIRAYQHIFKDILPNAVEAHGRSVPYWESSPMAKDGNVDDWKSGDSHYWGVWWGQEPFEAYRKNIGRFMSEYGFQSFPEFKTIQAFTEAEDWDIYSEVMKAHQKSSIGNKTIASYKDLYFRNPTDFKSYLYISQLLQAEGVKTAIEAHRINKPTNMGSLIWQLNDCWPAASWSGIDYHGRWKALHYYAKRAFEDIILAFEADDDNIQIHAVTDRYEELKGSLVIELFDFSGKRIWSDYMKVKVRENASGEIWKESKKNLLRKLHENEVYLNARLLNEKELIAENMFLFVPHRDLNLEDVEIKLDFFQEAGKQFVKLRSNKTALGVCFETENLELQFSDNFFTLHPKTEKVVEIKGSAEWHEVKNQLTVKSLIDSYKL